MICNQCPTELTGRQTKYCSTKCRGRDPKHKNNDYAAQCVRGNTRKLAAIKLKGGSCQECGYKKNTAALIFHHLHDKKFGLDLRQFSNRSQAVLDAELEKCVLLCHNCHMEEHHPELML